MAKNFIDDLLADALNDKDTREHLLFKIKSIIGGNEVIDILRDKILDTIKHMDLEDILYEILTEDEDIFRPVCGIIKRKLIKSLE